jgi:hypothetical protein
MNKKKKKEPMLNRTLIPFTWEGQEANLSATAIMMAGAFY